MVPQGLLSCSQEPANEPYHILVNEVLLILTTSFRRNLGPTQHSIQWVPEVPFPGIKWPECETNHSPLFSAMVKNAWSFTIVPP
jgi:hypothetical protein